MSTPNPPAHCRRIDGLHLLPEAEAVRLAALAGALSDPIRIIMVDLLQQHGDLCTCEFEQLLNLSQSKVSYHLKVLVDAELASRRASGTWSLYSLTRLDPLAPLRALHSGPNNACPKE